jgi:hypothetical protein
MLNCQPALYCWHQIEKEAYNEGKESRQKKAVRGKEVFVGIDGHKESWQDTLAMVK